MDNLTLNHFLNMVNEEKEKRGLNDYIPLYPMFRMDNGKLYVGIMLTHENANVWDKESNVKADYWVLIDIDNDCILEFNKTDEKDFIMGELLPKEENNNQKEVSEYTIQKKLQYKNYFLDDIKNEQLPIQKKLSTILNNEITIDDQKVNINDYLMANIEPRIIEKVNELVDLLMESKYNSITFFYDQLMSKMIETYKNSKNIDIDGIKVCMEIIDNYYDGVVGIKNFFNI